jgi:ketosteroid isomerase-like protein
MIRILLIAAFAATNPAFASAKAEPAAGAPAPAAPKLTPEEEAIHNELRAMRDVMLKAIETGDVDTQLTLAHPNIVVTWQNGDVTRGHEGLKALLTKMKAEQGKVFLGYKQPPKFAELSILYGNTAIAFGESIGRYTLLGKEVELTNKFTATLAKTDGKWLLTSYHVSNNILDNPLLNTAKSALMIVGALAGVVGVIVGFVLAKLMSRKA